LSHRTDSYASHLRGPLVAAASLLLVLGACGDAGREAAELAPGMSADVLAEDVEKFSPTTLSFDASLLDARQKKLVRKLVEASDKMDAIFLKQVWAGNPAMAERLASVDGSASQSFFKIMYGPWNRLEDNHPFLDVGPKPPGAGYYPADITKEEFETWIADELERIAECVDRLLTRAGLERAAVDRVFMTGGSSFVPSVRRIFTDRFGEERIRSGGELTSVANGLALRAAG